MEVFAVSMDLWHYVPWDWPVMLWPTYFAAILFGYQLLRLTETIIKKTQASFAEAVSRKIYE